MTRRTARALGAAIGLALCATGVTWIVATASERPAADGVAGSSWTRSPFTRHDELFPLLKSDGATFACPVSGKAVRWRETYVFNPAAVVRDGRVYLLFRAEDAVGARGGTSRIGLAESRGQAPRAGPQWQVGPGPAGERRPPTPGRLADSARAALRLRLR